MASIRCPREAPTSFRPGPMRQYALVAITTSFRTKMHECSEIQLIKRDCTKLTAADFPKGIPCCLIGLDLSDAVHKGLQKIWPVINRDGQVLVDDCPQDTDPESAGGTHRVLRRDSLSGAESVRDGRD